MSSAALEKILVNDYEPRLLIFGIHTLNYSVSPDAEGQAVLLGNPWLRYRLGDFNLQGWLYDRAYLYRYRILLRQLMTFEISLSEILREESGFSRKDYYHPIEEPSPVDMASPPDPHSKHPYDEHYFAELSNFQLLQANLEALDEISGLQSPTTRVIAVEMPMPSTYYYYFRNGEQDYTSFVNEIDQRLSLSSVPIIRTAGLDIFPEEAWFNRNHLNADRAQVFSKWLGQQVGNAVREGAITLSSG